MTDNANDKPQGGTDVQSQGDKTGQSQGESKTLSTAELLSKIDALEKDNAGYRRKQRENETTAAKAEEKRLAEQQEWQKLAEARAAELDKLKPVAEQHEVITAAFNASLDNRLKQIPDDIRKKTVDPIRSALSPVDFSNWLDANLDMLRTRRAPNTDAGAGSSAGGNGKVPPAATPDDIRQAANMRVPLTEWMKQKAAMQQDRANPPPEE